MRWGVKGEETQASCPPRLCPLRSLGLPFPHFEAGGPPRVPPKLPAEGTPIFHVHRARKLTSRAPHPTPGAEILLPHHLQALPPAQQWRP